MRDFAPEAVPKPPGYEAFDWQTVSSKVMLEIGCGNGMHPIQFARANPKCTVIAIEQTKNKFESFRQKLEGS
ncbi:MAG: SAM-dependent methyltransferase, partial [Pseudomonadota bacterium]